MENKKYFLKYNLLRLIRILIVIITCLIQVSFLSCISFDRLLMGGGLYIDTPSNIRNDKIINNTILPYIAEVLDYNNPLGTSDPILQAQFSRIMTVNNMNYDDFIDCQDYALLFYALCKYHNIPVKLIGNLTYMHAYNQIQRGFGSPFDIEPQRGENHVYFIVGEAMHGWTGNKDDIIRFSINTHPDNREFNPFNWGNNEQSRGWAEPNIEILNYVILNGKLPE